MAKANATVLPYLIIKFEEWMHYPDTGYSNVCKYYLCFK